MTSVRLMASAERGSYMGIYMNAIAGGNTIGPIICGFIVTGLSWRWHKWIAFILCAVNWVIVVLFVPETRYARTELAPRPPTQFPTSANGTDAKAEEAARAKSVDVSDASDVGIRQIPKKSWWSQLNPWSGITPNTNLAKLFLRPLPLLAYPAVAFSFIGYAVSLAWVLAINVLNPFVLQAPPYNWKPSINGLINIAGLIGNLIGAFFGGWVIDRYSDWRSRKNKGVFQPETRLHLLIFPAIIVPAGCLSFGYGVARTLHWTAM